MRISPTQSRSRSAVLGLLTLSAAFSLYAATPALEPVSTRDRKVVRRWSLEGDPRGVALGKNGIAYVGLAARQSVVAVDLAAGTVQREVVLDSEHIAATKELVSLRTNAARTRLYIANGSDESATILSLPGLAVIREITMEGELIRDAVPDPSGRLLFLLGRRVHIFDADGGRNLRTLPFEDPMAIAVTSNGSKLAVVGTHDFGNAKATVVAFYDLKTFQEVGREPLQTDQAIEAALFAASDRAFVALSRQHLFEKPMTGRTSTVTQLEGTSAQMRMRINFGDLVSSDRICLPEESGPQIATLGSSTEIVIFAERRCSSAGAFAGSERRITPASLYGVNVWGIAYDDSTNTVVATDREGYLTIYRMPRPATAR
ncbi:MAG TPA: hypothetical protein VM779_07080 [Thermoanaerobaculia bacterium]|nr:hypothetical protein [Thermoanaerobaculia bacterium]